MKYTITDIMKQRQVIKLGLLMTESELAKEFESNPIAMFLTREVHRYYYTTSKPVTKAYIKTVLYPAIGHLFPKMTRINLERECLQLREKKAERARNNKKQLTERLTPLSYEKFTRWYVDMSRTSTRVLSEKTKHEINIILDKYTNDLVETNSIGKGQF